MAQLSSWSLCRKKLESVGAIRYAQNVSTNGGKGLLTFTLELKGYWKFSIYEFSIMTDGHLRDDNETSV